MFRLLAKIKPPRLFRSEASTSQIPDLPSPSLTPMQDESRAPLPEVATWAEDIDDSFADQGIDIGMSNRVRTLGLKAGLRPDIIDTLAEAYIKANDDFRIEVSRSYEVKGLRRMILLGKGYAQSDISFAEGGVDAKSINAKSEGYTMIGITPEGLLFRGGIHAHPWTMSSKEAIRIARFQPDRLEKLVGVADIGIGKYSIQRAQTLEEVSQVINSRTMNSLGKDDAALVPASFNMALKYLTKQRISRRINLAIYAINDAMDPDILRLMRGCSMNSLADAEWICGAVKHQLGPGGHDRLFGTPISELHDQDLRMVRLQAVRSYPAMAKVIREKPEIMRAIDDREPLAPLVANILSVSEADVRRISGLTWQMAGVKPNYPKPGLSLIAKIPSQYAPSRKFEYRQVPLISEYSRQVFREEFEETFKRFARGGSPFRWKGELDRISPGDVHDAAGYIVDKLLAPIRQHALKRFMEESGTNWHQYYDATMRRAMIFDLTRSMSIKDIFELSDRLHRNERRHEDRLSHLKSRTSWPPLMGEVDLGSIVAKELTSTEDLKHQGRKEGHCVGGYTEKILRSGRKNATVIFSLEKGGDVIGTAEINITPSEEEPEKWVASIVQNRSKHNTPVTKEVGAAAIQLCKSIEKAFPDLSDAYVSGLRAVRNGNSAHERMSLHIKKAGYDIWDKERLETAWEELSGYLPRSVRKAGLEACIEVMKSKIPHPGMPPFNPGSPPFWEVDRERILDLQSDLSGKMKEECSPCPV